MNLNQTLYDGQVEIQDLIAESIVNAVARRQQVEELSVGDMKNIKGGAPSTVITAGLRPTEPPIIICRVPNPAPKS